MYIQKGKTKLSFSSQFSFMVWFSLMEVKNFHALFKRSLVFAIWRIWLQISVVDLERGVNNLALPETIHFLSFHKQITNANLSLFHRHSNLYFLFSFFFLVIFYCLSYIDCDL